MKLNLGCCENYKEGFVNVDNNLNVKADLYFNIIKPFPIQDNSVNYVLADNILEHINKEEVEFVMKELYRVCKNKAIIEIYSPHFTSIQALKLLCHKTPFGIGTFSYYESKDLLAGDNSNITFKILKEELSLTLREYQNYKWAKFLRFFNFLFNFNTKWKTLMERIWIFGFDEIYYKLEVQK